MEKLTETEKYVKDIIENVQKYNTYRLDIEGGGINEVAPLEKALEIVKTDPHNYSVKRVHFADDRAGICKNCRSDDCDDASCMDFSKYDGCRLCGSDDCECGYVDISA